MEKQKQTSITTVENKWIMCAAWRQEIESMEWNIWKFQLLQCKRAFLSLYCTRILFDIYQTSSQEKAASFTIPVVYRKTGVEMTP